MSHGTPTKTTPAGQSAHAQDVDREQLARWMRLPLERKLRAVEEMADLGRTFFDLRRKAGLPYVDPETGRLSRDAGP